MSIIANFGLSDLDVDTRVELAKELMASAKLIKNAIRVQKQEMAAARKADRMAKKVRKIAELEAKLQRLKNPVGTELRKAARKPSKVQIVKAA